jgi:hypothetical protein
MRVAEWTVPARDLIFGSTGEGLSADAEDIERHEAELEEAFSDRSMALTPIKSWLALEELYEETSVDNWDGYGARAVIPSTYEQATRFLNRLPTTVPDPEVSADPDGEISFEWRAGPWRVFSVSVGPTGRLTWAAFFGRTRHTHGAEPFISELPKAIIDNLTRLLSRAEL